MPDDTWWESVRGDLLLLVERLRPDDALEIIRETVRQTSEIRAIAVMSGQIRGFVARRDNEAKKNPQR